MMTCSTSGGFGVSRQPAAGSGVAPADRRAQARSGVALSIDLAGCDPRAIRDLAQIRRFAAALGELLGMPCTDPIVARCDLGCSLLQVHAGSILSGHFDEASGDANIDILSAEPYLPAQVAEFCRSWFGAASLRTSVASR